RARVPRAARWLRRGSRAGSCGAGRPAGVPGTARRLNLPRIAQRMPRTYRGGAGPPRAPARTRFASTMSGGAVASIAWIGLGHLGGPMSGNLVRAGHEVRGVDPDEGCRAAATERGVAVVGSIAEAVE